MKDTLVYCDICGEAIYSDETRYELPDGRIVCCGADCLEEWAAEYERLGASW